MRCLSRPSRGKGVVDYSVAAVAAADAAATAVAAAVCGDSKRAKKSKTEMPIYTALKLPQRLR